MRDNKGFTLIELLIVVVIIGILAAIAIPKFSATREKAYYAAMKSDLKNLASQQEIYYSDNYSYTTDLDALGFSQSTAVAVAVGAADSEGWSATATHAGLDASDICDIYYGSATSEGTAAQAGAIACVGG